MKLLFRYSNRTLYYTLFFGGALAIGVSTLLCEDTALVSFFDSCSELIKIDAFTIFIVAVILFGIFVFIFPFCLALKITDKTGSVVFSDEAVI